MSVEDAEDRAAFFEAEEFAVSARWSFNNDLVCGIFDADYIDPLGLFEGSAPVFHAVSADFDDDLDQGQTLTIDDVVYTIVEVRPDGTGHVMMRLRT